MEIYNSKRHEGIKAELLSMNEKTKVYTFKYLNGDKEGKTFDISGSTVKRWWAKLEEVTEDVEETPKNTSEEEVVDQETDLTDTQYAEIGKEIVEQAKEKSKDTKKKKNKKAKVDRSRELQEVTDFLKANCNKCCESVNSYSFKNSKGKTYLEVRPQKKNLVIFAKSVNEHVTSPYKDGYKYFLPIHYFVSWDDDYMNILKSFIEQEEL